MEADFPPAFYDLLSTWNTFSLDQRNAMLMSLKNNTQSYTSSDVTDSPKHQQPATSDDVDKFVKYIPDFIDDSELCNSLLSDLKKLKVIPGPRNKIKRKSVWLNTNLKPYTFSNITHKAQQLHDYPAISKLMGLTNDCAETTGDADACLVTCYSSSSAALSIHSDNEEQDIDQKSSINNISIGATRKLEFYNNYDNKKALASFEVTDGSLSIMLPGCQQILRHRICKGKHIKGASNIRFSLSFRKTASDDTPSDTKDHISSSPISKSTSSLPADIPKPNKPKPNVVLMAGDSFFERLKADKLGKRKKKVINIGKGGSKISQTENSIIRFHRENLDYNVDKVFLSVGTNDIRQCFDNGVKHLKPALNKLMKTTKRLFPSAKIFVQSLIPLPLRNSYTSSNVLSFNTLLYDMCVKNRIFYVNVFHSFLDSKGCKRNPYLFPTEESNCHPNPRGMGVLAKIYIFLIHSRRFNPLIF